MKIRARELVQRLKSENPGLYIKLRWLAINLRAAFPWTAGSRRTMFGEHFIFVVGSGRSGNTLLRRLLMEQGDIYIPPETYVLPRLTEYGRSARALSWPAFVDLALGTFFGHEQSETLPVIQLAQLRSRIVALPRTRRGIGDLVGELYKEFSNAAMLDSSWLGDKTPINTLYLPYLHRYFPRARYVFLYRDGVDVVASYVNSGLFDDYVAAARRWRNSYAVWKAFSRHLGSEQILELSYESLVRSPEVEVRKLLAHFGVPLRSKSVCVKGLMGDVDALTHHKNVYIKPNEDSVGKGRKSIPVEVLESVGDVLNPTLIELGYAPL